MKTHETIIQMSIHVMKTHEQSYKCEIRCYKHISIQIDEKHDADKLNLEIGEVVIIR